MCPPDTSAKTSMLHLPQYHNMVANTQGLPLSSSPSSVESFCAQGNPSIEKAFKRPFDALESLCEPALLPSQDLISMLVRVMPSVTSPSPLEGGESVSAVVESIAACCGCRPCVCAHCCPASAQSQHSHSACHHVTATLVITDTSCITTDAAV